ncbi:MAG: hypothetical protein AB1689_00340 [Thermodesulfobacteriota bacterium]
MAQVIIRNLDDQAVDRLKARARRKGVSLESELRAIVTDAARIDRSSFRERAARLRRKLGRRPVSDSTELIREDRDR